jgi:hypothetical protein
MNDRPSPLTRRLILGGALLAVIVVGFGPHARAVHAGENVVPSHAATARLLAQNDTAKATKAPRDAKEAAPAAKPLPPEAPATGGAAAKAGNDEPPNISISPRGITVDDGAGKKKHRVTVGIGDSDREYDSVDQFARQDPGLFAMVVAIVFVVFLTPVLVIALIVWYKLRKNRMLNDTMLQLAEKGVVPPAEALQALNSGRSAGVANALAAQAPLVEQAKLLRRGAAWSDLRRGVILVALGLALSAYSMFDDGTPNAIGLVLLFLGIGYGLLWYFEDRQLAPPAATPPPPAGGA